MAYYRKLKPGWWGSEKPANYDAACRHIAEATGGLPHKEAWVAIGQAIADYRRWEGQRADITRAERRYLKHRMPADVWACRRELLKPKAA